MYHNSQILLKKPSISEMKLLFSVFLSELDPALFVFRNTLSFYCLTTFSNFGSRHKHSGSWRTGGGRESCNELEVPGKSYAKLS